MANSYGNKVLFTERIGRSISVTADGAPKYKTAGVTIDWTSVAAQADDVVFQDGVEVKEGEKALRYGSIVFKQSDGTYALADDSSTLVRGEVFIVAETTTEEDAVSAHPPVIEAGKVFKDRILFGGSGQPAVADVEAAMPGILYVVNEVD